MASRKPVLYVFRLCSGQFLLLQKQVKLYYMDISFLLDKVFAVT